MDQNYISKRFSLKKGGKINPEKLKKETIHQFFMDFFEKFVSLVLLFLCLKEKDWERYVIWMYFIIRNINLGIGKE